MTAAAAGSKKQKPGEEDQEANIDLFLDEIKKDILEVYYISQGPKDGTPTEGKQTIEILEVSTISLIFTFYFRTLSYK
jgi:hypothetical protein